MYNREEGDTGEDQLSFDWNEANTAHLARHRITPMEAEELFRNEPQIRGYDIVNDESRWTAVGATNSLRVLAIVFTVRDGKIRPVTGWTADRQTRKEFFSRREVD